jgi:hypothetical protein
MASPKVVFKLTNEWSGPLWKPADLKVSLPAKESLAFTFLWMKSSVEGRPESKPAKDATFTKLAATFDKLGAPPTSADKLKATLASAIADTRAAVTIAVPFHGTDHFVSDMFGGGHGHTSRPSLSADRVAAMILSPVDPGAVVAVAATKQNSKLWVFDPLFGCLEGADRADFKDVVAMRNEHWKTVPGFDPKRLTLFELAPKVG